MKLTELENEIILSNCDFPCTGVVLCGGGGGVWCVVVVRCSGGGVVCCCNVVKEVGGWGGGAQWTKSIVHTTYIKPGT